MNKPNTGIGHGPDQLATMQIMTAHREHNAPYEHTVCLEVPQSADKCISVDFKGELDRIQGKRIIGAYVKKQNDDDTCVVYCADGCELVSNCVLKNAYLTLVNESGNVLNKSPLSHFVHDYAIHGPGQYKQLLIPGGIIANESKIEIMNMDGIVATDKKTCIEITFIYLDDKLCYAPACGCSKK